MFSSSSTRVILAIGESGLQKIGREASRAAAWPQWGGYMGPGQPGNHGQSELKSSAVCLDPRKEDLDVGRGGAFRGVCPEVPGLPLGVEAGDRGAEPGAGRGQHAD